jgi:nucleoid DNA-binding protein
MKKDDFIGLVSENTGFTKKDVKVVFDEIFSLLTETIATEGFFSVKGFGSFKASYQKPRTARNPQTQEPIEVPGKWTPKFKPGKALKESVMSFEGVLAEEEEE